MHRSLLQRIGADWSSQAAYFSQQSEILSELLHGASPQWEKPTAVAAIPYGYLRRALIAPTVFPLGDQLAVIPSFTGDGISIALYSGIAAAQAVLAGESAVQFLDRMLKALRPQFRWAGWLISCSRPPCCTGFRSGSPPPPTSRNLDCAIDADRRL